MAFGNVRPAVRVSSRPKSLSDLYDGAREKEPTDQPLDRIRQEVFVEIARHGRAVGRQQMRQSLLDALWLIGALAVALGMSAYYLDIVIGALLPLARPLARTDVVEGERPHGRRVSDPTRARLPRVSEPARVDPTLVDPGGAAVPSEAAAVLSARGRRTPASRVARLGVRERSRWSSRSGSSHGSRP